MSANLEYHIEADCKWCGFHNHFTMPVLGKDGAQQLECEHCHKFYIEIHSAEVHEH